MAGHKPARAAVLDACARIEAAIREQPEYGHTSHLHVRVGGSVVVDRHYRGPVVADVFSITKTVLATLVGVAVRMGAVGDLDQPLDDVLGLHRTPSQGHTWRHLLTMTRGSAVDGAHELDALMALPTGWAGHAIRAPARHAPGAVFAYDDGGAYLLGVALRRVVGVPLSTFADRELFGPLGIERGPWLVSPDGVEFGAAHLRLRAWDLGKLGELWRAGGRWEGQAIMDQAFAAAMVAPQSSGGPPEGRPYGYLTWILPHGFFAAGWAGQLVLVVPAAEVVVVTTGDPRFTLGPPPSDELPPDWRPAAELVHAHLMPVLAAT